MIDSRFVSQGRKFADLHVASDQRVKVRTESFDQQSPVAVTLDVPAGEERSWRRVSAGVNPFREDVVTKLFVKNYGSQPAHVTLTTVSTIAIPQMMLVPSVAVAMAGVFFVYLFQRAAMPKLAAVALSTAKSEIAQPLYAIIMAMGIFWPRSIFVFIPYFTLASDIKMLKDSGLSLILVLCIIQAVWAASTSVADEVEGKTALTVLSKPVSRRDFILGKFAGIGWSVGLMCVMLGLLLLIVGRLQADLRRPRRRLHADRRAMAQFQSDPNWQNCYSEMVQVVPGLVLAFLEDAGHGGAERGDFHAAAGAGQLHHQLLDLCARPPDAADRAIAGGRRAVAARRVFRPADRDGAARCSTISTSRPAWPPACPCRSLIWRGPRSIACSTAPWPCCWR